MRTMVRYKIFLISNLNQPGNPPKHYHTINTFIATLNNEADKLSSANKLYT